MKILNLILFTLIIFASVNLYAGGPQTQSWVKIQSDAPDEEIFAYYDLRDRKTYVQVTNIEDQENPLCIHVQIFQQDKGCSELNFEDELTPNDTVIYDMDNITRNDGTDVPVNLDNNSYGFVAVSAYVCGDRDDDDTSEPLIGNFRIIDDAGYEYRTNMLGDDELRNLRLAVPVNPSPAVSGDIIIPFNTLDGATQSDVVGFITETNRRISGSDSDPNEDVVYNEEVGITFSVFQLDQDEERLSCDQKTFGCGPDVDMNYGINEDYPNSKGGPLLCEGAGLLPGQTHGYISLENATFLSPLDAQNWIEDEFEFICWVGLNNGNNTGSMDKCLFRCNGTDGDPDCDT